jgi:3-dehydroquinate synthase
MPKVSVALGARSHDIVIEDGILDRAGERLAPLARGGRLIVVSDETVWAAQGERLMRGLAPVEAVPVLVPPGEGSKGWQGLQSVTDRLLALGIERGDHIVAFGGGVVGDLAGFAASIVNRGCNFVQVPTTLLAQVDSSVGGKTAINAAAGKNLLGAFHQPSLVLIDPLCLDTLEPRQLRSGYAEIVKYALIEDPGFFEWLEEHGAALLAGAPGPRRHAIAVGVAGKARIVEGDERETTGRRTLLNLGHTFGHAIEAEARTSAGLLHGEAVAVGIVLAFGLSVERGLCPAEDSQRVSAHLSAAGLPVSLSETGIDTSGAGLVERMKADKKRQGGRLPLILARGIGSAFVDHSVEPAELEAFLDRQS